MKIEGFLKSIIVYQNV